MPHEPMVLMADFGNVAPARETFDGLMPDPTLKPVEVPVALPTVDSLKQSDMDILEGEINALKHSMASLEQKYIALEHILLALKSTLDTISTVLTRKLGSLN